MNASIEQQLIELSRELLDVISRGDWKGYTRLCDPTLTAFEPEALGHCVHGLDFHRFYFDLGGHMGAHASTLIEPHVRLLGEDVAVVTYVRLVQATDDDGRPQSSRFEETRIWRRREDGWRHVHFHRSRAS